VCRSELWCQCRRVSAAVAPRDTAMHNKTAYADKLERDLAIGAGLLQIFRRKLYRGKDGGRTWEQWLADESAELTGGAGALAKETALRLRGFYQFRCEVLTPAAGRPREPGLGGPSLADQPSQQVT
jgi:hypothetical protein